jgi:hypothetical protein
MTDRKIHWAGDALTLTLDIHAESLLDIANQTAARADEFFGHESWTIVDSDVRIGERHPTRPITHTYDARVVVRAT